MKKLFCILLIVLIAISISACNRDFGPGNYNFTHVHISDGSSGYCAQIENWREEEIGIELNTKEFGAVYCSEGTYVLFANSTKCPFCQGD